MDLESKNKLVEKIISSSTFSNKEVMKGLLGFIFRATQKGQSLKEIDIAVEYFKQNDDFVPGDDTIVRVNIYKLRQLIDKYYVEEGRDDSIKIEIPKGSYSMQFVEESETGNRSIHSSTKTLNLLLGIVLFISLVINGFMTFNVLKIKNLNNYQIWSDYIRNSKPVCIVLGDPFFLE